MAEPLDFDGRAELMLALQCALFISGWDGIQDLITELRTLHPTRSTDVDIATQGVITVKPDGDYWVTQLRTPSLFAANEAAERLAAAHRSAEAEQQPKGAPACWVDGGDLEQLAKLGTGGVLGWPDNGNDPRRVPLYTHPSPAPAPDDKALTQALEERDAASDYIDALLDEVLGKDRHEWTSNYGHADAMAEVRERMATVEGLEKAVAAGFPVVARWTKNAKDGAPRARVWVQFEDGGPEVEFTSDLQAPAVGDGQ